jgi:hypothetical protein
MNGARRKTLTIFEGADGAGKSTAARRYAEATGARYIHCSAWPHVTDGLARLYLEAMLPALLGYQDVVMDRSWLSEQPYGTAYRNGSDRVGAVYRRMLERVALSCGALVVRCDPGPEVCAANWRARRHSQNRDWERDNGVVEVNRLFRTALRTELLVVDYDYTKQVEFHSAEVLETFRAERHLVDVLSAGEWGNYGSTVGPVTLVGESFGEPKQQDCLFQYPFVSFSRGGCSSWVTEQLEIAGVPERQLRWVNADQLAHPELHTELPWYEVVALGQTAHEALSAAGVKHETVAHPQHAKRFHHGQPYELVTVLKELLK